MTQTKTMDRLFKKALKAFPYPELKPTGIIQGVMKEDQDGEIEYSAEFTFKAGQLLNEPLVGGGWIELRRDGADGEIFISAFFGAARNGDWEKGRVLPEEIAIQGNYDRDENGWEFWIEPY
jgi:hypothetical protein